MGPRNGTEALEEKKKFLSNQEMEPHFIVLPAVIPYTVQLRYLGSKVIWRFVIFQHFALAVYGGLKLRSALFLMTDVWAGYVIFVLRLETNFNNIKIYSILTTVYDRSCD